MLDVKEVAHLFAVSEKTVYRWIKKNEIPAYKLGESYRFNQVEIMEWATARKIKISHEILDDHLQAPDEMPTLLDAINAGGIHYKVSGCDTGNVLKSIVGIMPLPDDVDREFLVGALLARENLGTTAIGDGIAIPHVRNPLVFHINKPILSLCFLEQPIDFKALDGKPVKTIFTIMTHTVRAHLHLLSRLSYALQTPVARSKISESSSRQEILDSFQNIDATLSRTQVSGEKTHI